MASGVREERCALSAHCSSEAAAITDLSEQPETPGPQPRQGSKAAAVSAVLSRAFSSKLGRRLPALACAVLDGMLWLAAPAEPAALSAELLPEPVLPSVLLPVLPSEPVLLPSVRKLRL